jgi:phage gp29-like protein
MAAVLLDHRGQPIDMAILRRDLAQASLGSVRSVVTGHPADGLTPARLAQILRGAEAHNPLAYLEMAEQLEEKYPHYIGVLGQRKGAVAQLDITVEPAGDDALSTEISKDVEDWIDRDDMQDELLDMLDAVGKGFSLTQINWETSAKQWWPCKLELVPATWVTFDRIDGKTPLLLRDDGQRLPLEPFKFIFHEHKAKSGLPIRGGLARPVAWAWLFQSMAWKDWLAFAEVYGLPLRVGRYENGESPANIRLLMNAVAGISSDAAAVFPKSMDVEFIDGKSGSNGGGDLFEKLCAYSDQAVSKVVVGQTATTDSVTGGLGSGAEHGAVREDLRDSDAKRLAATINKHLVRPYVDLNYGPQKKYPRVRVGAAESVDIKVISEALSNVVPLGLKVSAREIRGKFGLSEPKAGEELLQAAAPAGSPAPQDPAAAPPGSPPGPPAGPGGAATVPADPRTALSRLSQPITTAPTPEARAAQAILAALGQTDDAIDQLADGAVGDWEALMTPLLDPIEAVLADCSSLEEFRDRLTGAISAMNPTAMADLLARCGLNARLAGVAGVDIHTQES